ncbi:hypothetical protein INT43_000751 [Umbelopsis isabellina]|uniref:Ricin B lectin domain-containing protein n=1 Tax=Mortierella isabellina TaxID=91625 RepID=A0A8H7UM51_MORIS|nr:hypothetical protein INT43_000751 [Umbelopsis isabellina]
MVKLLLSTTLLLSTLSSAFASIDPNQTYRMVIAGGRRGCYNYLSFRDNWRMLDTWYEDDFSGNQHFKLQPVNGTTDTYNIIGVNRAGCDNMLSCNNCPDNEVNFWNVDDGSGRQRWKLAPVSGKNNTYTVSLVGGRSGCNTYLGLQGCAVSDNATLAASDDGSGAQQWQFLPVGASASTPLEPFQFAPLNVGEIKPAGWLRDQLQIQANGLAGHLYDFYSYINANPWVGGSSDYADLHESGPYWLNGMVPLAFQLEDDRLLGQVNDYVNYIISHQESDGWLGPDDPYILWPRFPAMLALMQYAQANSSATTTVVNTMHKFLDRANDMLNNNTGFEDWGRARWYDFAISVMWLLDEYPNGKEATLLNILKQVRTQGDDWNVWFTDAQFPQGDAGTYTVISHGVNNGQAMKSEAVAYRFSHDSADLASTKKRVQLMEEYHNRPSGIFGCDEHLAGNGPSRGSELCTVVETSYSYIYMYMVAGDNEYADYVERLIFNALPATLTEDMWAHQYLQQYNQISAKNMTPHFWNTDGSYSNVFGLEPNYPCCTVNHPQGWPKYVSHMFFTVNNKAGLVAGLLGPASVNTTLASNNQVSVTADTLYPFNSVLNYTIQAQKSFSFGVRIPAWATTVKYSVNGGPQQSGKLNSQNLITVKAAAGKTTITVTIPMVPRTTKGYNNATAVYNGPLAYALPLNYTTKVLATNPEQSKDYEFDASGTWQMAIDPSSLKYNGDASSVSSVPFSTSNATVSMSATVCPINWPTANSSVAEPPSSPATCTGSKKAVQLLPFGSTRLRMGEMPALS